MSSRLIVELGSALARRPAACPPATRDFIVHVAAGNNLFSDDIETRENGAPPAGSGAGLIVATERPLLGRQAGRSTTVDAGPCAGPIARPQLVLGFVGHIYM